MPMPMSMSMRIGGFCSRCSERITDRYRKTGEAPSSLHEGGETAMIPQRQGWRL